MKVGCVQAVHGSMVKEGAKQQEEIMVQQEEGMEIRTPAASVKEEIQINVEGTAKEVVGEVILVVAEDPVMQI